MIGLRASFFSSLPCSSEFLQRASLPACPKLPQWPSHIPVKEPYGAHRPSLENRTASMRPTGKRKLRPSASTKSPRFFLTYHFLPLPPFRPCPLATKVRCLATKSLLSCLVSEDTACPRDVTAGNIHLPDLLGSWVTPPDQFSLDKCTKKLFNVSCIIRGSLENLFFYIQLDVDYQNWSSLRYPFPQK